MRAFILAGLLMACGGATVGGDELGSLEFDRDSQLETVGQDLASQFSPTYSYGWNTETAHFGQACTVSSTTQICIVPDRRAHTYWYAPGASAQFKGQMLGVFNRIAASSNNNFTFTEVTSEGAASIKVFQGTNCGSAAGTSVTSYYDLTAPNNPVTLLEPIAVAGTYRRQLPPWQLRICMTTIAARGANDTQDDQLRDHAQLNAVLMTVGIGLRTDAASASKGSGSSITPFTSRGSMTTGEACRARSFDSTSTGTWVRIPTNCPTD